MASPRPVVLVIRDGWGHNPHPEMNDCNAIHLADTPVMDRLLDTYPHTQIHTSGEDVGLPDGVMGNSEVGHQNLGAGRIVDQELMRITRFIRDGSFFENPMLHRAIEHAKSNAGTLHLLGLLSDGGVHSHIDHLFALLDLCVKAGLTQEQVAVHVITDGRDTSPSGGLNYVRRLREKLDASGAGRIASVIGRYYAMDRDNRWDRVRLAYDLLTKGCDHFASTGEEAVRRYYDSPSEPNRKGDEFVLPTTISTTGQLESWHTTKPGDALVFFNYRGDRPREISKAFVLPDDQWARVPNGGFDRGGRIENLFFATLTNYEQGLPVNVIYEKPPKMVNTLGDFLHSQGMSQFRCAESEKHPHVTFFFNDYRSECFDKEFQLDIPSPKYVSTYDQLPEMSARAVTHAVINAVKSGLFDFVLVNYANCDMVGHTGDLQAAIAATTTTDEQVGNLVDAVQKQGGALVITSDHGNCEQMIDPETGGPHTKHTTYDVDVIVVDDARKGDAMRSGGRLADVAPTVLDLMGLRKPTEMTGVSLLQTTED